MSLLRLITFRQQAIAALDPAQAFISAAGITDSTQQAAITQLVSDLKSYNLWDKMKAVYPFVGGTATSHSYNLVNTAQFQMSWTGSITHDSNGVTTNNSYGNTGLVPSNDLILYNSHLSVYYTTSSGGGWIGSWNGGNSLTGMSVRRIDNRSYGGIDQNAPGLNSSWPNLGLRTISCTAQNVGGLYDNATKQLNMGGQGTSRPTFSIYIGALNRQNTPDLYDNKNWRFFSIGDGLSDAEVSNLYTAVQAFQTTLGRQV
jgi:hypothetical protein